MKDFVFKKSIKYKKQMVEIDWKRYVYCVVVPWWNATALVEVDDISEIKNKIKVNDAILKQSSEVEQVWFILADINNPYLEMAGGGILL